MENETKQNKLLFLIPVGCCVVLILAVLLLSGCQTSSVDALNVGSPQALTLPASAVSNEQKPGNHPAQSAFAAPTQPLPPSPPTTGANNNGFYPTIGRERTGATKQLNSSDLNTIREELRQASEKSSQRATTKSAAEYQNEIDALRKKAATHGSDALKKIEEPNQ